MILQELYDKCLSDASYVEVMDPKVKQIIRRMLKVAPGKTIIISAPVYLLALLKNKYAPLVLEKGGTALIISNFRGLEQGPKNRKNVLHIVDLCYVPAHEKEIVKEFCIRGAGSSEGILFLNT